MVTLFEGVVNIVQVFVLIRPFGIVGRRHWDSGTAGYHLHLLLALASLPAVAD
jgi:hypothetical protein